MRGRIKKWMIIILAGVVVIAAAFVVVSIILAKQSEPVKDRFIPVDGSQYVDENGNPDSNIWLTENSRTYYVGDDGVIVKDKIIEVDGKDYLLDEEGVLVKSKNLIMEDKLYSVDGEGVITVKSGLLEVDGEQYFGKEDGTIVKGWTVKDGKKEYYLDEEGHLIKDRNILYQGKIYAADEQGVLKTVSGWQEVDGKKYYGKRDGSVARNTRAEEKGVIFYLDDDGQLVKSAFYTFEDKMYYADANGKTRTEEGWFTLDGKEYYSDSEGAFYQSTYITVDKKKYYMDKTGAKIDGKPTIDQYLKCDDLYGFMTSHFTDYYFKTPYRDLYGNTTRPERLIMPIGLYGDEAGMNCTGFISSLVKGAGGDLDMVSDMGRFGGYGNADNYLMLATKGYVRYEVFKSVKDLLKSGRAKKGNILYLAPRWKSGDDCHMAVFWGDTPSENAIWSQTAKTLCTVTEIYMVDPINQIFMFPLERNLDVYEDN